MKLDELEQGVTLNIASVSTLGNILLAYSDPNSPYGCLADLRRKRADINIRAVLCTTNSALPELFENSEHFDDVELYPWRSDWPSVLQENSQGDPYLNDLADLQGELQRERLPLALDDEEQKTADEISSRPFVVLHLFAGQSERNWYARIGDPGAERVCRAILDSGYDLVILGATTDRLDGDQKTTLTEEFAFSHDRCRNLINKASVRLGAELLTRCAAVVGALSCWTKLSTAFHKPAWIVAPQQLQRQFSRSDGSVYNRLAGGAADLNWWWEGAAADPLDGQIEGLKTFLARLPKQQQQAEKVAAADAMQEHEPETANLARERDQEKHETAQQNQQDRLQPADENAHEEDIPQAEVDDSAPSGHGEEQRQPSQWNEDFDELGPREYQPHQQSEQQPPQRPQQPARGRAGDSDADSDGDGAE